ncbi:hypothetical protein psyc5s11_26380 [Clostridium gelidum]|uniref:Stage 0 sporulation protein A homolog n=1 Tax=Clostridium gelidum TaxID=704125 RepID=A0ABN6IY49_9CLOT|nr:transporter substrate-binding domain-containing protein [Clostridium gelidum]BCZ46571.1 hypothetical protein psyc5s11_26380 [Clostridium gelidum]
MKRFIVIIMFLVVLAPIKASANDTTSIPIKFTAEEQAFIKEHPTLQLGVDPEFIPYEFIDSDGQYKGIANDYIQLLSQRIGMKMMIEPDKTWSEAYEMGVEKKVDVLPCISKTTERQQYFLFSDPYFAFQRVTVVQENNTTIKSLEDLKYTTVAVQRNSSHHSYLKNIPEINLSLYDSVEKALVAVSKGDETSFVGNLATSAYLIKSSGLTGLKYVSLDTEDQQSLYFAVRNDYPLLVSIINKGLASITEEEKMVIRDKWIGLENHIDYSNIIKTAAIAGSIIIIIFVVSIYWIIRLNKEISKRILIQDELNRAKIEAEIANRVKSTFLARMSHEIRTPLNAITGMAYLIKKSDITLSQKMYVDKITQAAHNMLSIINDILDFSKIEAGKVEIEDISFNLDKVIQQVISIISFRIEEQGIGFALTKEPQIPVHFIGDPKRIEQILLNLLSNAVKFTKDGEVSLGIRLIAQEGERYHLEFAVKDTGIGMSEDQIAQLFMPFSQADSSITRRFGGTGLGLSIVKSLVEMMNGEIHIYSAASKGSTFVIKLPLMIDAFQDFEEKKKVASFYVQNVRTLVLAKNDNLINLMQTYLVSFGIHAEFTKSPSNVQQLLRSVPTAGKIPFNLLIVDYDILAEQSFDFAKNILDDSKIISNPKIIMLIPLMREDLFEKIESSDLNLGITKPIIPSVLFDGIQEIFKKNDLESSLSIPVYIKSEEKKATKNYTVLVVEDNKTNQFIAKSILEPVGVNVILTDNGEEGVTYYTNHASDIDLILMDLHMPVLNGYDATLQIRMNDENVPIVAMTADAITGIEEQCKRVGINYYISKPFEPDKFIDTILEILDQHEGSALDSEKDAQVEITKEVETVQQTLPLINQDDALKLLGQNVQLYHMVLKEYIQENVSTCEDLDLEIQKSNYLQAAQIVHKAKGSSGNVGAKEVYKIAVVLQKALENNQQDEISKFYPEFNKLLNQSLAEIEEILKE